jgi:hypothetical protein
MTRIESTKCNKCISSGGGDCSTCDPPRTTAKKNKEYIITEDQLKKYEGLFFLDDDAQEDFKTIRSRQHNPAPQENQILVTFKDKAIVDYILLVSRRKGYDLGDYIEGNFEWDDMLPCIDKIDPEDCQFCDFRKSCPDRVGETK